MRVQVGNGGSGLSERRAAKMVNGSVHFGPVHPLQRMKPSSPPDSGELGPGLLAIEITGCVNGLSWVMGSLLYHLITQPELAGWKIDVFAVLDFCQRKTKMRKIAVEQLRKLLGDRVVSWQILDRNPLTLDGNDTKVEEFPYNLKPEVLTAHPDFPYQHKWSETNVRTLLFMTYKFKLVGQARGEFMKKSNKKYDLVIRTRPDLAISSQFDWSAHPFSNVTHPITNVSGPANVSGCAYITPRIIFREAHTDLFAILTPQAADFYNDLYYRVAGMYKDVNFHPETMLQESMYQAGCEVYMTDKFLTKIDKDDTFSHIFVD